MFKRQVFFSFEYVKDAWRASQVRNMGKVSASSTLSDNDWETVKSRSDSEIRSWIDSQLAMRSCLVVLIGETTSTRKWVKYEIEKAYELNKGIVGIYIHKLEDRYGEQSSKGANPFYSIYTNDGERLSKYVECFDSIYQISKNVYKDIWDNIYDLIEYALEHKAPQ